MSTSLKKILCSFIAVLAMLQMVACTLDEQSGEKPVASTLNTKPAISFYSFLTTQLPAMYTFSDGSADLSIKLGQQAFNIGTDSNVKLYGYGFDKATDITFRSSIVEDSRGVKGVRIGYYESNARNVASAAKFQVLAKDVIGNIYLTESSEFDVYTVGATAKKEVIPLPLFLNEVAVGESWNSPATLIPFLRDDDTGWLATLVDDNATAPTSGTSGCVLIKYQRLNSAFYWYLKPGIGLVEWIDSWTEVDGKLKPLTGYSYKLKGGNGIGPEFEGYGLLDANADEVIIARKGAIGHIIKINEAAYTSGDINGREFPAGTLVPANPDYTYVSGTPQPQRDADVYQFFNFQGVKSNGGLSPNAGTDSRVTVEHLRFPFDVSDQGDTSAAAAVGNIDFRTAYPDLPVGLDPYIKLRWKGRDNIERTYIASRASGNVSVKLITPLNKRFGSSEVLIRGTVVEEGNPSNTREMSLTAFLAYDHSVAEISVDPDPIYTYQANVSRTVVYGVDVFGHLNNPLIYGKDVRLYYYNDAVPYPFGLPITKSSLAVKPSFEKDWRNPDSIEHSCWGAYNPQCDSASQSVTFSDSSLSLTNESSGHAFFTIAYLSENTDGSSKALSFTPWYSMDVVNDPGGENLPPKARIQSTFEKDISGQLNASGEFTVNFNLGSSNDSDGFINKYSYKLYKTDSFTNKSQWVLQKERDDIFPASSIKLTENGKYVFQVTVTDDDGATDTVTKNITVSDRATIKLAMRDPGQRSGGIISKYFKVQVKKAGEPAIEYEANALLDFGGSLKIEVLPDTEYDITLQCCGPTYYEYEKKLLSKNGESISLSPGEEYLLTISDVVTEFSGPQPDLSATLDSDGDGVNDALDAFPNDPAETLDTDGDGVGDNADAFPNDSSETVDTDGDGVGDNRDAFPNNIAESADSDGDGVGDNADAFPNDSSETLDTDGDGVGDNADLFPNDPLESADLDKDGIGDNSDPDIDGDGVNNDVDAYPLDPTRSTINNPPTTPVISISPGSPSAGSIRLTAVINTPSTDADGDAISYRYKWTGVAAGGLVKLITSDTSSQSLSVTASSGDRYSVSVSATDGVDSSASASATVTVR